MRLHSWYKLIIYYSYLYFHSSYLILEMKIERIKTMTKILPNLLSGSQSSNTEIIMSVATGDFGNSQINCLEAFEIL